MRILKNVPELPIKPFKEGELVKYQNVTYFLSEIKGEKALLLPIEAMNFEDLTLDLTRAKLVSLKFIKKI